MRRRLIHTLVTIALTVLASGFLTAFLVRRAPGSGVDEREFDARFSQESIRRIREETQRDRLGFWAYCRQYLVRAARGDLGLSSGFQRPVASLIAERLPETAWSAGAGLAGGWTCGMLVALAAVLLRRRSFNLFTGAVAVSLLSLPSSVLALGLVLAGASQTRSAPAGVIALVIAPRVFGYARAILGRVRSAPYVFMARARGVGPWRLVWAHVVRPAAPALLALLGVSVSVAFAAAIPAEVICDSPGIGQLAWQAALKRDLPLLIDLTLLVSLLAGISGLAGEIGRYNTAAEAQS